MFIQLAAAAFLWPNLVFGAVLAQGPDFNNLPTCATSCITAVAQNQNCVIATPNCICPSQIAINRCIEQECSGSLPDMSTALSIIFNICLPAPFPSPSSSSKTPVVVSPPTVTPNTPTTTTSSTPSLPPASTSSSSSLTQSPLPLTQLSLLAPSTTSTPTTSSTNVLVPTPSITLTVPPTALNSPAQPTVVVFSTQFAPPQNSSGGSALGCSTVSAFISVLVSGVVGIFVL